MAVIEISDAGDPRLADYLNLSDAELLRSRGLFIAEGRSVVRRLLTGSRFGVRSLLLTPAARAGLADVLPAAARIPVFLVNQDVMQAATGFNIHRGCLAAGERPPAQDWAEVARHAARAVVLEHVSNADNVGAAFRNAAAFGAGAVLLGPSCADPLYRKAIRTSMGAALRVPFAAARNWPVDLGTLRALGFTLWALTPAPGVPTLRDAAARAPAHAHRIALLVGHEGEGLSEIALNAADLRVRIPMADGTDSLNVATALAIALYEVARP